MPFMIRSLMEVMDGKQIKVKCIAVILICHLRVIATCGFLINFIMFGTSAIWGKLFLILLGYLLIFFF